MAAGSPVVSMIRASAATPERGWMSDDATIIIVAALDTRTVVIWMNERPKIPKMMSEGDLWSSTIKVDRP